MEIDNEEVLEEALDEVAHQNAQHEEVAESSDDESSSDQLTFNDNLRKSDAAVIQIQKIADDAEVITSSVQELKTITETLDYDQLAKVCSKST